MPQLVTRRWRGERVRERLGDGKAQVYIRGALSNCTGEGVGRQASQREQQACEAFDSPATEGHVTMFAERFQKLGSLKSHLAARFLKALKAVWPKRALAVPADLPAIA